LKHQHVRDHGQKQVLLLAFLCLLVLMAFAKKSAGGEYAIGPIMPKRDLSGLKDRPTIFIRPVNGLKPGDVIVLVRTAYCPCHKCTGKTGPWNLRRTSTGTPATDMTGVAADPRVLPPGTWIFIPGIGMRHVDDVFRSVKPRSGRPAPPIQWQVDIRMPNHEAALRIGDPIKVAITVIG